MNKIDKPKTSKVVTGGIVYQIGGKNTELAAILKEEQKNVCAYTQARITSAFSVDVEHFNPTIKGSDDYENWYAVSTSWNRKKSGSKRWNRFRPTLRPCDADLETKVIYKNGRYDWADGDVETEKFIEYLNLNQEDLLSDRQNHLKTLRQLLEKFGNDSARLKKYLIEEDPNQIQYLRAIQEELGITF